VAIDGLDRSEQLPEVHRLVEEALRAESEGLGLLVLIRRPTTHEDGDVRPPGLDLAEHGMTQQELAEAADLDYKSIQRLEAKSPRFHPKVDTLEKIAKAFGLTVSALLKK